MESRDDFRSRIFWLTFLFSLLVVWVHSYNAPLFLGAGEPALRVEQTERLIGDGLGQIAVPGFFMVSGYLFYRSFSWDRLLLKWKTRVRSLLVPYFIWNLLYYLGYVLATRIRALHPVIGKEPVEVSLPVLLRAVALYAYNPVFWYVFQLILLTALAPLLYLLLRRTWTGLLWLLLLLAAVRQMWDVPLINEDALLYYSWAAFAALHREGWGRSAEALFSLEKGDSRRRRLAAAWSGALAGTGMLLWLDRGAGGLLAGGVLGIVLLRLWGVHAAWLLTALCPFPEAPEWTKHSFFLYAIHFACVRLVNKLGAKLLPGGAAAALGLYAVMPALMVLVSMTLTAMLRRCLPSLYRILSGGR